MSLLVLIPLSLGMGVMGLCAFFWALRHDQFSDPEGNARRILIDHDAPLEKAEHAHRPTPKEKPQTDKTVRMG